MGECVSSFCERQNQNIDGEDDNDINNIEGIIDNPKKKKYRTKNGADVPKNIIFDNLNEKEVISDNATLKKVENVDGTITKSVESPKAELLYTKDKKNFRVIPYPQLNDSILPGYQNYYEKYKTVVNEFYPELTWGLTYE